MYIIQENVATYTWVDVYECVDENMAEEFKKILTEKHTGHKYRIVRL